MTIRQILAAIPATGRDRMKLAAVRTSLELVAPGKLDQTITVFHIRGTSDVLVCLDGKPQLRITCEERDDGTLDQSNDAGTIAGDTPTRATGLAG